MKIHYIKLCFGQMNILITSLLCILCVTFTAFADPQPTGGALCLQVTDCGGLDAGICRLNVTSNETTCVCFDSRGNPDCSYVRKSRGLCGGLQFICFAGVGGIGNFVCERIGPAVGQLILTISFYFAICGACCLMCAMAGDKAAIAGGIVFGIFVCVLLLSVLAGIIWSVIDGAMYLQGNLNDGNGYATY